jgi:hypothetical protein
MTEYEDLYEGLFMISDLESDLPIPNEVQLIPNAVPPIIVSDEVPPIPNAVPPIIVSDEVPPIPNDVPPIIVSDEVPPIPNAVPPIIVSDEEEYDRFRPFRYHENLRYRVYPCPFPGCRNQSFRSTERKMLESQKKHRREIHPSVKLVVDQDFFKRYEGENINIKLNPRRNKSKKGTLVNYYNGIEIDYHIIIEKWVYEPPNENEKISTQRAKKRKFPNTQGSLVNTMVSFDRFSPVLNVIFESVEQYNLSLLLLNYPSCEIFVFPFPTTGRAMIWHSSFNIELGGGFNLLYTFSDRQFYISRCGTLLSECSDYSLDFIVRDLIWEIFFSDRFWEIEDTIEDNITIKMRLCDWEEFIMFDDPWNMRIV